MGLDRFDYAIYSKGDGVVYFKYPGSVDNVVVNEADALQRISLRFNQNVIEARYGANIPTQYTSYVHSKKYKFCF